MRTLVATTLSNAKGKDIYCTARKIDERWLKIIRDTDRQTLEDLGFTFIRMISLEVPNIKGYAIFFEGHVSEMERALNTLQRQ
ncbi:MAG TPA: hypothetical protein VN426_09420 [Syntrophomonadaceae bacterium]|nr:hypothetical protein [Syntrophomonadaceae bacterium]